MKILRLLPEVIIELLSGSLLSMTFAIGIALDILLSGWNRLRLMVRLPSLLSWSEIKVTSRKSKYGFI